MFLISEAYSAVDGKLVHLGISALQRILQVESGALRSVRRDTDAFRSVGPERREGRLATFSEQVEELPLSG